MLFIVAIALGIAAGLLTGGRLGNLANLHVRWPWLLALVLLVRVAAVATPLDRVDQVRYAYLASLIALVLWTLWQIARLPGILLVSAGAALNVIVIVANDSRMPVAGGLAPSLARQGHIGQYTLMSPATNLSWLGDWIAFGPLPGVYSPGDLVSLVGIAMLCYFATRARQPVKPWAL